MSTVNVAIMKSGYIFGVIGLLLASFSFVGSASAAVPGGFIEQASDVTSRPLVLGSGVSLPTGRGTFTFPAPYDTTGYRLTSSADCSGSDCVGYVGYSYWRNMNNSAGSNTLYAFIGMDHANGGPTLFSVDKTTDQVSKVGPLFDPADALSWQTGEGWYFSVTDPHKLYIPSGGSTLDTLDIITKQKQTVFDLDDATGIFGNNRIVWQTNSSADDLTHSFTVRNSSYQDLGCGVYLSGSNTFKYYPQIGLFDECQIDKSGRYLVIKEQVDGLNGEDNRIIDLVNNTEVVLLDPDGAAGHSDLGFGYMASIDNYDDPPSTRLWDLSQNPAGPGTRINHDPTWAAEAMNHLSWGGANTGPLNKQLVCGAGAYVTNYSRQNEIACFKPDDSLEVLVVAPVMTDLNATGGADTYERQPKGNVDPTGKYFIWTSNLGSGGRLDAFIVKIPYEKLTGEEATSTPDILAPVRYAGTPAGVLSAQTTQVLLYFETSEPATCKFSTSAGTSYDDMSSIATGLGTIHFYPLTSLVNGASYAYYIRCRDVEGNTNQTDHVISFSIAPKTPSSGGGGGGGSSGGGSSSGGGGNSGVSKKIKSATLSILDSDLLTNIDPTSDDREYLELIIKLLRDLVAALIEQKQSQLDSADRGEFTLDLALDSEHEEVRLLQVFLNSRGHNISDFGPGSVGQESNYFGVKTQRALARFQSSVGLPSTGYFGPMTREWVSANY